jgi:Prp8 binding protein
MADGQGLKRKPEDELQPSTSNALVVKKQRTDSGAIIVTQQKKDDEEPRTSDLLAPIMLLEGHEAEVNSLSFSLDGLHLASGSADKNIFLWNVFGDCENYGILKGHKNQVLEVRWTRDSTHIVSASADCSGGLWDVERLKRVKRFGEHTAVVNSISAGTHATSQSVVTASDDGTAKLWDIRVKGSVMTIPHPAPLTAVAYDNRASETEGLIYAGGIDNQVHAWDLRNIQNELFRLIGHRDTITSIRLDPYNAYVLTNAMDHELRVWDIRPYAPAQRCVKVFVGAQHNFERNLLKSNWAPDGSMVTSGSADRMVYIWDTTSREIRYKLPGHTGTVMESAFHPKQPIIGSCGTDKKIYLGEIVKYGTA